MPTNLPTVLFVCVHNAGRSQMAAAWLEHLAGGRVRVLSGGSAPAAEVNPAAVAVMAEAGIDISGRTPQPWTEAGLRSADVVVTMGCGDACPFYPGKRYEDWGVADPQGRSVDQVCLIRDDIQRRVRRLLEGLGVVPG
jgi:arsenate reductase (thioredoxin)